MLEHLQEDTEQNTTQVAGGFQTTLEAISPTGSANAALKLEVGLNLGQLGQNVFGCRRLSTDANECVNCGFRLALPDIITRGLGEEDETTAEDDSPGELDSDRDAVGARVGTVLGSVIDDGCKEKTDGDCELVTRNDSTTDLLGCNLGHVEDDGGGDDTDGETSNDTTANKESNGS